MDCSAPSALRLSIAAVCAFVAVAIPALTSGRPPDPLDATPSLRIVHGAWGPDPAVFSSHMVLQSNDVWSAGSVPARIWGWADANESVTIEGLADGMAVYPSNPFSANASGYWTITISAPPSRIAVNVTFRGASGQTVVFEDVVFGAVFLCSGQSNMDMNMCVTRRNSPYTESALVGEPFRRRPCLLASVPCVSTGTRRSMRRQSTPTSASSTLSAQAGCLRRPRTQASLLSRPCATTSHARCSRSHPPTLTSPLGWSRRESRGRKGPERKQARRRYVGMEGEGVRG